MKAIVPAWRSRSLSQNLFNEFDSLFENIVDNQVRQNYSLDCDVDESEKYVMFSFDLPGVEEKDIHIEVKDALLVVSGERKAQKLDESSRSYQGRKYGEFKHHFRLPKFIDTERIEANYSNGVLKVLLPKVEQAQPKKIEIQSKEGGFFSQLLKGSTKSES